MEQMSIPSLYFQYVKVLKELFDNATKLDSPHSMAARYNHAVGGSLKFVDAYSMALVLERVKPHTILEIGSFIGMSTRWQCEIMRKIHGDTSTWQITALDPNMRHRIFDNPRAMVESMSKDFSPEHVEVVSAFFGLIPYSLYWYQCEEANPKMDKEAVDKLLSATPRITGEWDRRFDCIFIDANHSYESVHENFDHAVKLLNPKGTIIFHDALTWEGVNKALMEIKEAWKERASLYIIDSSEILNHPALDKIVGSKACDGIGVFTLN